MHTVCSWWHLGGSFCTNMSLWSQPPSVWRQTFVSLLQMAGICSNYLHTSHQDFAGSMCMTYLPLPVDQVASLIMNADMLTITVLQEGQKDCACVASQVCLQGDSYKPYHWMTCHCDHRHLQYEDKLLFSFYRWQGHAQTIYTFLTRISPVWQCHPISSGSGSLIMNADMLTVMVL